MVYILCNNYKQHVSHVGVCAGRIGRVKANISIQSAISGLRSEERRVGKECA